MQSKFKNLSNDEILAMRVRGCIEDKTELFQLKMKIIHPTYDFSEFVYQKSNIKGTYYCDNPEHGTREAIPNSLLRGAGCLKCAGSCPEEAEKNFFIKMKIIHPTYDFSEFVYKTTMTKGTYFCDNPDHGPREASPDNLLSGQGCSACAGQCPVQAEKDFFIKMKIIHPTYDFSEFVYKGAMTKGTYYCDNPEHGPREAAPTHLLNGKGCLKCAGKCPVQAEKDFFTKMKEIHPTYDFSEFVYKGAHKKGTYYCDNPEHGAREANPTNLLNGYGCRACAGCCPEQAEKNFFEKMKEIHPTYDFSEFVYKGAMTKGTYYCDVPEHGPRKAVPSSLLKGQGCSICNKTHRVQQTKIFEALKEFFPTLHWIWEERYSFMNNLEFDISVQLPNGELVAVEYDGEQHYMPVNFGGRSVELSEAALLVTQALDKSKDQLAIENNVTLIRIPYYEWKECNQTVLDKLYIAINKLLLTI